MKTTLIFVLVGAILGAVVASLVVPPMLASLNEASFMTPQNPAQSLVKVPEVVRYASSRLIRGQLVGAAIGAVVFFVFGLIVATKESGRRKARVRAKTAAPPS